MHHGTQLAAEPESNDLRRAVIGLCCPLDLAPLDPDATCTRCGVTFPRVRVGGSRKLDLRALDHPSVATFEMKIPQPTLPDPLRASLLSPRRWRDGLMDREAVRARYGTKLSAGLQHHLLELRDTRGTGLRVLDLGCGNGGNRAYLRDIGIADVVCIDWWSEQADVLADAHRLPFGAECFDIVIATAVLEHCYLPPLAMRAIARVLRLGGVALLGASFWEAWHGESFYHFTPNGLYALCDQAELDLTDLWSGWGFIPAVLSHAVSTKLKRPGYRLQRVWDAVAGKAWGVEKAYLKTIRTSGSLHFRADRRA